jgi:hypothetical protein
VRFTLPTTAWERSTNRLGTKSAHNNARSSNIRTNSVQRLKAILEEKTTLPLGTIIRKSLKKEHSMGNYLIRQGKRVLHDRI